MWIQTYTGRKFWPLNPSASDVCIEDIAHALALKCRYTGHCREFFSIAQHSVAVSRMVPESDALWGLLHDAGEAYLPDVARPIKDRISVAIFPGRDVPFEHAEGCILRQIAAAFSIPYAMPPSIRSADVRCLERERRQLMGPPPQEWHTAVHWDGDTTPIRCWDWRESEVEFLARFDALMKKGGA